MACVHLNFKTVSGCERGSKEVEAWRKVFLGGLPGARKLLKHQRNSTMHPFYLVFYERRFFCTQKVARSLVWVGQASTSKQS